MAIKTGSKKSVIATKTTIDQKNSAATNDLAQNLRLLKAILNAPTDLSSISSQPRRPKTPLATVSRQNGRTTKNTRLGNKDGKIDVIDTKEEPAVKPPSSIAEQKKLALSCFNQSLKVLSAVVRKQQASRLRKPEEAPTRDARSAEDEDRKPSKFLEEVPENITTDAECVCSALAVLRLHDHQEASSEDASYMREQGAVLLLDKMITLDLRDLAHTEASRIYEQYWKRRKTSSATHTSRKTAKKIDLADLLCGISEISEKRDFDMVTSFQSQLLRLAILVGPIAVDNDFVHAVGTKTRGSPVDVIVSGQKNAFVTPKLAGENLRIISQALSKISSAIVKPAQSPGTGKEILAMELLVEAQLTKLIAWQLLKHEPDLAHEFWMPVEKALKTLWSKRQQDDLERYSFTKSVLKRLQVELRAFRLRSEIPDKLDILLYQLAEINEDNETAIVSLERLLRVTTGIEKLSYTCRVLVILLRTCSAQDRTTNYVEELEKLFVGCITQDATLRADDLVSIVRLRKACFAKLSLPSADQPREDQQVILTGCLRILPIISQYCYSFCSRKELDEKLQRSLRLAILKTIENYVDIEKYATRAQQCVFFEYLKSLENCIKIVSSGSDLDTETLRDEFGPSILSALKVRISNVFWRSHLHAFVTETSEITAVRLAQISVTCLDGLPLEELRKAALGPRLEKLSGMCEQAGELAEARAYIETAIKHYILTGALSDAVEASLSKRSGDVWIDAASLASQLGRALHIYNSISMKDFQNIVPRNCLYDSESSAPIHRAVLLEYQVSYLLRKDSAVLTYQPFHELIHKVVELVSTCQYHVWILRFVSATVFRASKLTNLSSEDTSQLVNLVNSVLRIGSPDANAFLQPYRTVLETQLKLQRALLVEPSERNDLRPDLEKLLEKILSCSELEKSDKVIDDFDSFRSVLHAYTDQVLALHDYEAAILSLKIRICVEERWVGAESATLSDCYLNLAISQVRLDDTRSAGLSLAQADKFIKPSERDPAQAILFHLASAEYHLATSEIAKCKSSLHEAGIAFAKSWPPNTTLSSVKQIERDAIVAKATMLASVLALRQGDSLLANQYARQATKISVSIWSALEKRIPNSEAVFNNDSTVVSLTETMSKLNIETEKRSVTFHAVGPRYWPHLDMYIRSIKHLASILSHSGLCEDALHYFKQLKHLTSSMLLSRLRLDPAPALSLLFAKAGRAQEAIQMITDSASQFDNGGDSPELADGVLSCCEAYVAQGNLLQADALLSKLPAQAHNSVIEEPTPNTAAKSTKPTVKARRGISKSAAIKAPPKRQNGTSNPKTKRVVSMTAPTRTTSHLSFNQILNESRRKAIVLACQQGCKPTSGAVQGSAEISLLFEVPPNLVQELHEEAKRMLSEAWETLSGDAFASVLTESAMALPSRTKCTHRTARVSFLQGGGEYIDTSSTKESVSSSSDMGTTAQKLQCALKICKFLLEDRHQYCPTDMIHSLVKMEARISLLLTSMSLPYIISSTELVLKASQPKDCALERERIVSLAEQATQDRLSLSTWPCKFSGSTVSPTHFIEKQLNELSASWSIISLALAEDNDELLLSKTVAGSDPFLVRIPLRRSNEGSSADEFVFEDASIEMKEIIEAANSSSHDIRGTLDKATRTQWHADREMLDQKLASLLENIETIWLGGFRGVLSPYVFEPKRIKQFGRSLAQSLDKNLPSRQKNSVVEERVQIHEHILEIFLGLGNPDENDLDDSVMDLLYFVVDILQFNGERNAYDEIDWDVILIDVLDALKAYHNSISAQQPRHTILILDKELEMFSWEALPCLINHPVSRMPSLGSIFDRLTQMRAQSSFQDPSAYTIKKSEARGTAILNPSGDLTSTQDFFEPILSDNLSSQNYTFLINDPPTEPQFSSLLIESDIFVYIGHGSGAQYIRPRTIRALPSCAVTFLFGCSSAKMTTHGAFESTGMPRAYMLGHAPAVVGCLWDVTDKEIDRVALQTLVSWGLVNGKDKRVMEGLKRKGRRAKGKEKSGLGAGVGVEKGNGPGRKTLIEAVKDGREACVLRYLCGAAVVVYGVPVVLE